jgi:DNA-binding transcriptional MerR regulator
MMDAWTKDCWIGRFAVRSGLSVAALRHFDDIGIPKPAEVDPRTSHRRCHPSQLSDARLICSLRGVELPIDDLRKS